MSDSIDKRIINPSGRSKKRPYIKEEGVPGSSRSSELSNGMEKSFLSSSSSPLSTSKAIVPKSGLKELHQMLDGLEQQQSATSLGVKLETFYHFSVKFLNHIPNTKIVINPSGETSSKKPKLEEEIPRIQENPRNPQNPDPRIFKPPVLCKGYRLWKKSQRLEGPLLEYRGDPEDLEMEIKEEYLRRIWMKEGPKYFFTPEQMKYLIDKKFFPGRSDIAYHNITILGKLLPLLVRKHSPNLYQDSFQVDPPFALLYFKGSNNYAFPHYRGNVYIETMDWDERNRRGAFQIDFPESVVLMNNAMLFKSNSLQEALFCMFAAFLWFGTPKHPTYERILSRIENIVFGEKLISIGEAARLLKLKI